jgi:hypothetical protein
MNCTKKGQEPKGTKGNPTQPYRSILGGRTTTSIDIYVMVVVVVRISYGRDKEYTLASTC